eukprot:UN04479
MSKTRKYENQTKEKKKLKKRRKNKGNRRKIMAVDKTKQFEEETKIVIEEGCCPLCLEMCAFPVVVTCGHSFCEDCIGNWLEGKAKRTYLSYMSKIDNFNSRP